MMSLARHGLNLEIILLSQSQKHRFHVSSTKEGRAHKRRIRLTDWEEKMIPEAAAGAIERVVNFHMS